MQESKDYFRLQDTQNIQGKCTDFISPKEHQWRDIDALEQHPFRRVATYIRNNQYTPSNTRTVDTLKHTLNYLIHTIFPLMIKPNKLNINRERVAFFLEERLVALRCQYFVQGVVYPKEILKILKCMMLVWMFKGMNTKGCDLAGLQFLIQAQSKQTMQEKFAEQYREALKFAIFATKAAQLHRLLAVHQDILGDGQLSRLINLRLKIEQNNYQAYYRSLQQEDTLVRCLMWMKIEQMKSLFSRIVRKAFGDIRSKWFYKRLCLCSADSGEWMSAKQIKQQMEGKYLGFSQWMDGEVVALILAK